MKLFKSKSIQTIKYDKYYLKKLIYNLIKQNFFAVS